MTERLYYHDAQLTSFEARVVDRSEDGLRVYLDRTAFYPASGGQPHDLGTIDGVPVIDVVDEDERVAHVLQHPLSPAATAGSITGLIDWPRRFDHMQQHTGQHLLSSVCEDLLGAPTLSVHFGPDLSTLDIAPPEGSGPLSMARLGEVERRANALVAAALPVSVSFEDAATAAGLRKTPARTGTLRIVAIEGIDRSACGGTHVRSTSEIGPVLLRGQERVRSAVRLTFVCGQRAIARAHRDFEVLSGIAKAWSASIDDLPSLASQQTEQVRALQSEHRRLLEELAAHRAEALYRAAAPGADGLRRIIDRPGSGGADASRSLALATTQQGGVVFIAASHVPPTVLLATSPDSGLDAGRTLRPLLEEAGGRGGGSPRLAQGSVPTPEAVDRVVARVMSASPPGTPTGTGIAHRA